ncbi:MAG TPA: hypothetical protein VFM05_02990 [Candidatus Saccharimonadales bacterium]|nr:hypothetical protein [Candidatus Saccharimonadales bacterium]
MSYLNLPRLCFAGVFSADPSTVNNTPQNYDPAVTNPSPGWNPGGTGYWQFIGCTVQAVYYADGSICTSPEQDPIVGATFGTANQGSTGKIVDLDPEQQMVSEIWGQKVQLGTTGQPNSVEGKYDVAAFTDIWIRAVGNTSGSDAPMGASYQSVITSLQWGDSISSQFLKELKKASPDKLSIKFNLDGINMTSGTPTFTQGRIVGTIGPALKGEPDHLVFGRLLRSAPTVSSNPDEIPSALLTPPGKPIFFTPCKVEHDLKKIIVDVGNSISTTTPGGPMNTDGLGNLALAVLLPGGGMTILGDINYQGSDWYTTTAGIQEFNLTDPDLKAVEAYPLAIVRVKDSGENEILIQENSIGAFVRANKFVFRMEPGEEVNVELYATVFGKPAANQLITLVQDPASVNNMQSPPNPDSIPIGTPQSALQMAATVTTDAQGRAPIKLTASDPGNPRQFIDGQVYGVRYIWGAQEPPDYNHDPTSFVSVLVHDSYTYEDPPTWTTNVEPILGQYAKLYPYMTDKIVNLGNYQDVVSQKEAIRRVLSIPKDDPGYMQVTRDMSRDKLQMILKWLDNPIQ